MSSFAISVGGDTGILERLKSIPDALGRNFFAEASEFEILSIQTRTLEGEDADGRDFEEYSPAYKLFREEEGRQGEPVNLFFHGDMFNAMTYDISRNSSILFFATTSDKEGQSNAKKAFFLQQQREFFALSDSDIKGIMDIARKYTRRQIRGRK